MGKKRAQVIDFDFRPKSYFGPVSLATRVKSRVKGEFRRRVADDALEEDGERGVTAGLLESRISDAGRLDLGSIHPGLMGGEYLPDLGRREVEIARVSQNTVMSDAISVRARPSGKRIKYSVVDEHEGEYDFSPKSSTKPLTLAELIALMDGAGITIRLLDQQLEWGIGPEDIAGLLEISSGFYPALEHYYNEKVLEWESCHISTEEVSSGEHNSSVNTPVVMTSSDPRARELVDKYKKRFNTAIPIYVYREMSSGGMTNDKFKSLISEALLAGEPVKEWEEQLERARKSKLEGGELAVDADDPV